MMQKLAAIGSLLMSWAAASQPSAPEPVAAPMRALPWGDLNFLHTTDSHGWHAGHLQEPQYSADWGDYISLAARLREKADRERVDLLLIDTGDRIEGNGLYDASHPKGDFTYNILRSQDIDIITIGNHELYQANAAAQEFDKNVPDFEDAYIASNLDYIEPKSGSQVPMAPRYRKFITKNKRIRVLAFGFLFNFKRNANNTVVQSVEDTVQELWFQQAIREDVDLFVVAGHVMLDSVEYRTLFTAIRSRNPDVPIQFFGGHSHIRDFIQYDAKSYGMQSGRYMETIGWLSMNETEGAGTEGPDDLKTSKTSLSVKRRYIDNNLFGFHHHTGLNHSTFPTDIGKNVSVYINDARVSMGLDEVYGCAPRDLWLSRSRYPSEDSLLSWMSDQVMPSIVFNETRANIPRIALANSGTLRFDIYKGPFTRDTTYIVSPFRSIFLFIRNVPYRSAQRVQTLINQDKPFMSEETMDLSHAMAQSAKSMSAKWLSANSGPLHRPDQQQAQAPIVSFSDDDEDARTPILVPGYTTVDDAGDDGDDTIHSPIHFHRVPNCIETRTGFPEDRNPETVDLVFVDFIQPWVMKALRFLDEEYTDDDVEVYTQKTLTDLMVGWIKSNWRKDC